MNTRMKNIRNNEANEMLQKSEQKDSKTRKELNRNMSVTWDKGK